jgi:hypothetical protein
MRLLRRPSALLVAALVLLVAFAGLSATRKRPHVLPRSTAVRDVLHAPRDAAALSHGERWTNVRVIGVDLTETRVSFLDGPRLVAEAAVAPSGRVVRFTDVRESGMAYGVPLTYRGWLLAVGCIAFVLAVAVVPLRRVRNLDVLALLAFVVPVVALEQRLVVASTLTAVPSLAWLAGRCAWFALGPRRPPAPARPLLDALTPRWSDAQRVRMLRLAVGAAALCVAAITITAEGTVDVAQALMEGATLLVHGVLPYGHMPGDVFHGDVYPLLSYATYVPLALVMPVHDVFDVANGGLIVAALAAVGGAWLLARWADRAPGAPLARGHDAARAAGLRAALAWLAFPPLVVTVSSGTSDVLLAVLVLGALVLARRPLASANLMLLAGWFKLVPFALLPVWLARLRGRSLAAALAVLVASSGATLAVLLALGGSGAPATMLHAMRYQLERQSLHSLWILLGIPWLQPLGQAAVLALVAGATVRVRRDAELAGDPARLAALAAAVMLGLELVGNYWTFLYLAWILPCVVISLLADATLAPATATVPAGATARRSAREPALV